MSRYLDPDAMPLKLQLAASTLSTNLRTAMTPTQARRGFLVFPALAPMLNHAAATHGAMFHPRATAMFPWQSSFVLPPPRRRAAGTCI